MNSENQAIILDSTENTTLNKREVLEHLDGIANELLFRNHLCPGMVFKIDKRSKREILGDVPTPSGAFRAEYEAHTGEERYYLDISVFEDKENERSMLMHGALYRKNSDGEYDEYNFQTHQYEHWEEFSILCKMIESSELIEELVDNLAWRSGLYPQQLDPSSLIRLILRSEELIELRKFIGDNSCLSVIGPEGEKPPYSIDDVSAILTSGNPSIYGNMITYDDAYHLCQYISDEDFYEYFVLYSDKNRTYDQMEFRRIIFSTKDKEKIKDAAMFLWNIPTNNEEDIYSFPISGTACITAACLKGPYFVQKNKGHNPELTNEELKNIQVLTAWFENNSI